MATYLSEDEYSSESSYCESCGTSCNSDSDSDLEYFPWLDKVGEKGELFYIEANLSDYIKQNIPFNSALPNDNSRKENLSDDIPRKLNPAKRLKSWMKKRKRKVRKSFPLSKSSNDTDFDSSNLDPNSLISFRDLYMDIISPKPVFNRHLSFSEELLGLKIGSFEGINSCLENQVKILGFTSNWEIPGIKYGDWLKSINDIDININNVDNVLRKLDLSLEVKLTLSSPFDMNFIPVKESNYSDLVIDELLGNPECLDEAKAFLMHIPHGIFYLTIEDESCSANEGVLYRYPDKDTPLFQLKGMFMTLSHMIPEICAPPLLSCSVLVQDVIIHAGCHKEGNDTLLLALPSSCCTVSEIQHFVSSIAKLLKFQFSSLKSSFIGDTSKLDTFFTFFLKHYLSKNYGYKQSSGTHLLDFLPSVHWLPMPSDVKTEIDDILSELESSDFGSSSDGFDENQRIYSILGSCLFYKGYLLCNHLQKSDLLDIHLYLHFYKILLLTKSQGISELIIWKEVFPSHRQQEHHTPDPQFVETEGRYFMLIAAMQHCILGVLLEAGGCSFKAEGHPPPEPFYVEEVQNTLIILHDCGIISAVERLTNRCLPPLKDSLHPKSSNSASFLNSSGNFSQSGNFLQVLRTDVEKGLADGESDIGSSYSDISLDNLSCEERLPKTYSPSTSSATGSQGCGDLSILQVQSGQSSFSDTNGSFSKYESNIKASVINPVAGSENTLFQYLHMDPVEGVFLAPILSAEAQEIDMSNIQDNFYCCCLKMRTVFARSLRNEEILKSSAATKYGVNGFLRNVYEQGTLFSYSPEGTKVASPISFWVIGRLFFTPEPRELYVCYQDSSQQDIVEIAFRLGFGLSL